MQTNLFYFKNALKIILQYTGCLNIHGTHMTVNNFANNNVVFFFASALKIVYYNNY